MPIIRITAADLAKTLNLEPGWYSAKIIKAHPPAKSSKGDSVNFVLDFLIDHPSKKEIPVTFNTKLIGRVGDVYKAVMGKPMPEGEFDLDALVGKQLDVKISPNEYNGNLIDNIMAYLPLGKSKDVIPF